MYSLKEFNEFTVAERQQEYLRQADQERLARQAALRADNRINLQRRLLIWLGRQLMDWGNGLQQRYAPLTETQFMQAQIDDSRNCLNC